MKIEKRSKTYKIRQWEDWCELARKLGYDPQEEADMGIDIGGGDSISYEYIGDYPEKEER